MLEKRSKCAAPEPLPQNIIVFKLQFGDEGCFVEELSFLFNDLIANLDFHGRFLTIL